MRRLLWLVPLVIVVACNGGSKNGPSTTPESSPAAGASKNVTDTQAAAPDKDSEAAIQTATAAAVVVTPDPTTQALAANFKLPRRGSDTAKVVVFEFSDYLCPFCREFVVDTEPAVIKNYVDSGQIALVFWDFPLPNHGYPALIGAEAAHCAGEQGKYWEMHDAMYKRQADLEALASKDDKEIEGATIDAIVKIAPDAKVEGAALKTCLTSKKYRPIVQSLAKDASDKGINQTPTFVISSQNHTEPVMGTMKFEEFKPILDREIGYTMGTPVPTDTPAPPATATPKP